MHLRAVVLALILRSLLAGQTVCRDIGNTNKQGTIYGEIEIKKEAEKVKTKGF